MLKIVKLIVSCHDCPHVKNNSYGGDYGPISINDYWCKKKDVKLIAKRHITHFLDSDGNHLEGKPKRIDIPEWCPLETYNPV